VIEGLTKRPPTRHVRPLNNGVGPWSDDAYVHFINRDGEEKYVVMFDADGTIKVFEPSQPSGNFVLQYGDADDQTYLVSFTPNTGPPRWSRLPTRPTS
jgi:outer membrane protein assembly factor BamB